MVDYLAVYEKMQDNNIMLTFKGEVTFDLVNSILKIIENRLEKIENNKLTRKKVYNVLVEALQNLCKHLEENTVEDYGLITGRTALLLIETDLEAYRLVTGNYISNDKVESLKKRLDEINSVSKEELRELYKRILNNGQISEKGGAGLGFIDIARKSGQKLQYSFQPINDKFSFFTFQIDVPKQSITSKE
jgi:tetrahydromethanopterin S-methyltransferase subunit G